jgi:hypothetical protein
MNEAVFSDFEVFCEFPVDIIEKYEQVVPKEIVDIWKKYGLGSFRNGFIKIINPDEYREILDVSFGRSHVAVPLFATGMGDIITWQNSHSFMLISIGRKHIEGLGMDVDVLLISIADDWCCEECMYGKNYPKAVEKNGPLAYDECFGYVPLLGLGGAEKAKNLQKVKTKEHILLITELLGAFE